MTSTSQRAMFAADASGIRDVTLSDAYAVWPEPLQRAAREALRHGMAGGLNIAGSDLAADLLLERIWNAITEAHDATK